MSLNQETLRQSNNQTTLFGIFFHHNRNLRFQMVLMLRKSGNFWLHKFGLSSPGQFLKTFTQDDLFPITSFIQQKLSNLNIFLPILNWCLILKLNSRQVLPSLLASTIQQVLLSVLTAAGPSKDLNLIKYWQIPQHNLSIFAQRQILCRQPQTANWHLMCLPWIMQFLFVCESSLCHWRTLVTTNLLKI